MRFADGGMPASFDVWLTTQPDPPIEIAEFVEDRECLKCEASTEHDVTVWDNRSVTYVCRRCGNESSDWLDEEDESA